MRLLEMKAGTLEAGILPGFGGKIASLRWRGVELLQAPLRPPAPRDRQMSFDAGDASGWDECLPSVAACRVRTASGVVDIPDHGEVWRLPCEAEQNSGREAQLSVTLDSLPLRLERTLALTEAGLRVNYRLENTGKSAAPYMWAAHPLFAVEAGDEIVLPSQVAQARVEDSAGNRLGVKGRVLGWPVAESASGAHVDLSRVEDPESGVGDKLFTAAPAEGWAILERRRAGLRVRVSFDPSLSPWLGLWLCYGGWPQGQAVREQCVAFEPSTAPSDSLAEAQRSGWARTLAPGESTEWWTSASIEEIRNC